MERKSKAQTPGKCLSLFDQLYDKFQLEEITIPFSTAKVERLNRILDLHSSYFRNIVAFDHNNFEITITLEKFDSENSLTPDKRIPGDKIEKVFFQFIALYETAKSRGLDFIDFSCFNLDPEGNVRFSISLSKEIEPDLSTILPIFQNTKHSRTYMSGITKIFLPI